MNTTRTAIWARRLAASGIVVGSLFAASGTAGAAAPLPDVQEAVEAPRVETTTATTVDLRLTDEVETSRVLISLLLPAVQAAVEAPEETNADATVDLRLTAGAEGAGKSCNCSGGRNRVGGIQGLVVKSCRRTASRFSPFLPAVCRSLRMVAYASAVGRHSGG